MCFRFFKFQCNLLELHKGTLRGKINISFICCLPSKVNILNIYYILQYIYYYTNKIYVANVIYCIVYNYRNYQNGCTRTLSFKMAKEDLFLTVKYECLTQITNIPWLIWPPDNKRIWSQLYYSYITRENRYICKPLVSSYRDMCSANFVSPYGVTILHWVYSLLEEDCLVSYVINTPKHLTRAFGFFRFVFMA